MKRPEDEIIKPQIERAIQRFREGFPGMLEELWRATSSYIWYRIRFHKDSRFVMTDTTAKKVDRDVQQNIGNYLEDALKGDIKEFWEWVEEVVKRVKRRALRYYGAKLWSFNDPLPPEVQEQFDRAQIRRSTPTPLEILIRREDRAEIRKALELLPAVLDKLNYLEQYTIMARLGRKKDYQDISRALYGDESKADYLRKDIFFPALRKIRQIYEKDYGIKELPF